VTRVMVVDDEALVREGLRLVLEHGGELQVVAEAASGSSALDVLASCTVDVVLLDIRMPEMDGIEAARRITARADAPPVVMLTTFSDDALIVGAIRAGASGYLLKSMPPAEIRAAVHAAVEGRTSLAPSLVDRLVQEYATRHVSPAPELSRLTERELDVLRAIAGGLSNVEIGSRLFVSEGTVKTHVAAILRKLGLRDRTQAAVAAYELGLVRPGGGTAG
jgi:DNA-binding NarL/FixJ family response regulator